MVYAKMQYMHCICNISSCTAHLADVLKPFQKWSDYCLESDTLRASESKSKIPCNSNGEAQLTSKFPWHLKWGLNSIDIMMPVQRWFVQVLIIYLKLLSLASLLPLPVTGDVTHRKGCSGPQSRLSESAWAGSAARPAFQIRVLADDFLATQCPSAGERNSLRAVFAESWLGLSSGPSHWYESSLLYSAGVTAPAIVESPNFPVPSSISAETA